MVIFPDLLIEVFKEDERIKYLQEAGDMGNKEQDRHIKGTQLNIFFKKHPVYLPRISLIYQAYSGLLFFCTLYK